MAQAVNIIIKILIIVIILLLKSLRLIMDYPDFKVGQIHYKNSEGVTG
jgi:hypothetical protein